MTDQDPLDALYDAACAYMLDKLKHPKANSTKFFSSVKIAELWLHRREADRQHEVRRYESCIDTDEHVHNWSVTESTYDVKTDKYINVQTCSTCTETSEFLSHAAQDSP